MACMRPLRVVPGKKLLIASIGVATANFVGSCSNTSGNLAPCDPCPVFEPVPATTSASGAGGSGGGGQGGATSSSSGQGGNGGQGGAASSSGGLDAGSDGG